jgi:uncharacterized membrane-anchored protein
MPEITYFAVLPFSRTEDRGLSRRGRDRGAQIVSAGMIAAKHGITTRAVQKPGGRARIA